MNKKRKDLNTLCKSWERLPMTRLSISLEDAWSGIPRKGLRLMKGSSTNGSSRAYRQTLYYTIHITILTRGATTTRPAQLKMQIWNISNQQTLLRNQNNNKWNGNSLLEDQLRNPSVVMIANNHLARARQLSHLARLVAINTDKIHQTMEEAKYLLTNSPMTKTIVADKVVKTKMVIK